MEYICPLKLDINTIKFCNENDKVKFISLKKNLQDEKLSKCQRKKIIKQLGYLVKKKDRRLKEKVNRKKKALDVKSQNVVNYISRKRLKLNLPHENAPNIVIDFSFHEMMTKEELSKCLKQIQRCYAINRRSHQPMNIIASSFSPSLATKLLESSNYLKWNVSFKTENLVDIYPLDKVVYLTSDSSCDLETIDPSKYYIIGGLVDHNKYKGHCLGTCLKSGINHARLPIDKYIVMKKSKVLTIDHVFNILSIFWLTNNWLTAFQKVIPKRKEALPILSSSHSYIEKIDNY